MEEGGLGIVQLTHMLHIYPLNLHTRKLHVLESTFGFVQDIRDLLFQKSVENPCRNPNCFQNCCFFIMQETSQKNVTPSSDQMEVTLL